MLPASAQGSIGDGGQGRVETGTSDQLATLGIIRSRGGRDVRCCGGRRRAGVIIGGRLLSGVVVVVVVVILMWLVCCLVT